MTVIGLRFEPTLVESIRPGDEIDLLVLGPHVVSEVITYDDGEISVIYFRHVEAVMENRARDKSGFSELQRLVERGLKPHRAGDMLMVRRGDVSASDRLRAQMIRSQSERDARAADRRATHESLSRAEAEAAA